MALTEDQTRVLWLYHDYLRSAGLVVCERTAVWRVTGSMGPALVWLRSWRGPTTPGGIEEAHNHCVEQVRTGTLPPQASGVGRRASEPEEVGNG